MKTLAILKNCQALGGAEKVVYLAAGIASDEGFDVDLLLGKGSSEVLESLRQNFGEIKYEDYIIHNSKIKDSWWYEVALLKYSQKLEKERGYDLIISHHSYFDYLPYYKKASFVNFFGPMYSYKIKINKLPKKLPLIISRKLNKYFYNYERFYPIATSEYVAERTFTGYNKNLRIIHPPINQEFIYDGRKKNSRAIYHSRISREKRNHLLLDLAKEYPYIDFYLVGRPTDNEYFKEIKEKSKNIENLNVIPNATLSELSNLLKSSRVYVHLSKNEAGATSLLEALASGNYIYAHNSGFPGYFASKNSRIASSFNKERDLIEGFGEIYERSLEVKRKDFIDVFSKYNDFERKVRNLYNEIQEII